MVRRTKEEALATRRQILDAAERVFEKRGVSGTSLHEVAASAGLTRGAIYWHFKDKADLFNAMMERVTMPLEGARSLCAIESGESSLAQMRAGLRDVLKRIVTDPQMRRVFEIATHKVEYVAEMKAVHDRHLRVRDERLADMERTLKTAIRRGELTRRMPARTAAIGLHALIDGVIRNWMLDPEDFDLVKVGMQTLDAYVAGLSIT